MTLYISNLNLLSTINVVNIIYYNIDIYNHLLLLLTELNDVTLFVSL